MYGYTLCVTLHTVCKITHYVWNSTLCVQNYTGVPFAFSMEKLPSLENFYTDAGGGVKTNIRYAAHKYPNTLIKPKCFGAPTSQGCLFRKCTFLIWTLLLLILAYWDQWFSDGFGGGQPLVTMVFNGFAPLVRRWNGYVPSLKSRQCECRIKLKSQFSTRM